MAISQELQRLFVQHGEQILLTLLQSLAAGAAKSATDESEFERKVIEPGFKLLPLPLRIIGRQRLAWDDLCRQARFESVELKDSRAKLRPDAAARVQKCLRERYPASMATMEAKASPAKLSNITPSNLDVPVEARGRVVGIDFGTTYSVIAFIDDTGHPTTIPNGQGQLITPSVVYFDEAGPIVGEEALKAAAHDPTGLVTCVKRDMGKEAYHRPIRGEAVPPEAVSSMILRRLKLDAEAYFGEPVQQAVITVPAYFDEPRRRATIHAGTMAGLHVLAIINEPTAASIAYGHQLGLWKQDGGAHAPNTVLVFDLGGGTFDVTVLRIEGTSFEAKATDGDMQLGGKDWDAAIVQLAAQQLTPQIGSDPRSDAALSDELMLAAEAVKKSLGQRPSAPLYLRVGRERFTATISREDFERATAGLVRQAEITTTSVLDDAGLSWKDIDRILLCGGSTRLPAIPAMLERISGKKIERLRAVDEAVAHGATLYADLISKRKLGKTPQTSFSLTNVNSHSLGIVSIDKQGNRVNTILIPKNSKLPCAITKTFRTHKPSQEKVAVRVLEGESTNPDYCTKIGVCLLDDLPPNLPVGSPIEVTYAYASDGRLSVKACLRGSESTAQSTFQRAGGISKGDMRLWETYGTSELTR